MIAIALFPGDSALLLLLLVVGAFVVLGMITDGLRMAMLGVAPGIAYFAAPLLGQDNQAIYCDELGLPEEELETLRSAGVI